MSASSSECADKKMKRDMRSNPPTLGAIASRFNMPVRDVPAAPEKGPESTQSLKRLELTGRLESAAANLDATHQGENTRSKLGTMPSLNDIRARLNQRGVDITPSAWSPTKQKSFDLSQQNISLSLKQKDVPLLTERLGFQEPNVTQDSAKVSTPDQPFTSSTNSRDFRDEQADSPTQDSKGPAPSSSGLLGRKAALEAKNGVTHPLQNVWTLYVDMQRIHGTFSGDQYEATLKRVGHFTTLESFFDTFATLRRPSRQEKNSNYHLFKNGVKPMWEDPVNAAGGRWIITLRDRGRTAGSRLIHEALLDRSWMWLVLALIGETLDENDLVTGAVCSLRGKGDRIAIWTRRKEPIDELNAMGQKLLDVLDLRNEPSVQMEFSLNFGSKDHQHLYMKKSMASLASTSLSA